VGGGGGASHPPTIEQLALHPHPNKTCGATRDYMCTRSAASSVYDTTLTNGGDQGCPTARARLTSWPTSTSSCSDPSRGTTLTATPSPVVKSVPRYTLPYAPSPRHRPIVTYTCAFRKEANMPSQRTHVGLHGVWRCGWMWVKSVHVRLHVQLHATPHNRTPRRASSSREREAVALCDSAHALHRNHSRDYAIDLCIRGVVIVAHWMDAWPSDTHPLGTCMWVHGHARLWPSPAHIFAHNDRHGGGSRGHEDQRKRLGIRPAVVG
jgi:hypothetical protein